MIAGAEEGRRVSVRRIARIRVGGRDDEGSTAYYAYMDGERHVMSKNPHLLLRMAGARTYQQVFGRHGFDYVMGYEAFGISCYIHDTPVYWVKSLPNGWYGWRIDIKHLVDGQVIIPPSFSL